MKLPNDISRCINEKCSLKNNCLRFLDRSNGRSYSHFNEESCASYWPASK